MALSVDEFMATKPIEADMCGCGCGAPLDENDPCGPQFMVKDGKRVFVNPDCYLEQLEKKSTNTLLED